MATPENYDSKMHNMVIDDIKRHLGSIHEMAETFADNVEWQHAGLLLDYVHHIQQLLLSIQGRLFYLNRIQAMMDIYHKGINSYHHEQENYVPIPLHPTQNTLVENNQFLSAACHQPMTEDPLQLDMPLDEFLHRLNQNN